MNDPTPTYDEMVSRYGLTILESPGDLQIENGDIAVTKDGDLKLGDTDYNALFRLVQRWRYTAPSLKTLFKLVYEMREKEMHVCGLLNQEFEPFSLASRKTTEDQAIQRYHELNDAEAAAQLGYQTYAGAIIIVVNGLLGRFGDDLDATAQEWNGTLPLTGGLSVGAILVAAANSFRHQDEWAKTHPASPQQLKSMRVLASALGEPAPNGALHKFGRNVCFDILQLLSERDFELLGSRCFAFAHAIVINRRGAL